MQTRNHIARAACLAVLMAGPAMAQGTGNGQSVGTLDDAERVAQQNIEVYNRARSEFNALRSRAAGKSFEVESDGAFNDKTYSVSPARAPDTLSEVNPEKMVHYLPGALLADINKRIAREYFRGHWEWKQGMPPPMEYAIAYPRYAQNIFVRWDQEIWGEAPSIFGIIQDPIDGERIEPWGSGGGSTDISRELADVQSAARVAAQTVQDLLAFRPDIEEIRKERGRFNPARLTSGKYYYERRLRNEGDWNLKKGAAESAIRTYSQKLEALRNKVINMTRTLVEQVVRYESGDIPALWLGGQRYNGLGFRGTSGRTNTGNGYGSIFESFRQGLNNYYVVNGVVIDANDSGALWTYVFDQQVMQGIPQKYRSEVRSRVIQAYFKGALHAKYDTGFSSSGWYGNGWGRSYDPGYTWRNGTGNGRSTSFGTGTGNGYSGYGGDRRQGSYLGRNRTGRSWANTGNGTTTGPGTSTGPGTNTGGRDLDDPWSDFPGNTGPGRTNTGPGRTNTGPGRTNTGPGRDSTGPGRTNTGPGRTNTGPGNTDRPRGTGTGTGSGE